MLEILGLFGLLVAGFVAVLVLAVVFGVLKLAFKLLAIPLGLAWGLVKLVLFCCLILACLVLAPVALAVCLVALPFLLLAGVAGCCWAVVT